MDQLIQFIYCKQYLTCLQLQQFFSLGFAAFLIIDDMSHTYAAKSLKLFDVELLHILPIFRKDL